MTNFNKQIFSVLAAGSMVLNTAVPAFASTTIEISGNGAGSDNAAAVQSTNTTTISQSNNANVTNTVNSNADTGNNDANYNTGGSVGIQTGDAKAIVNVSNDLNKNMAEVDCCANSDTDVKISGNGAYSNNEVGLVNTNVTAVQQSNNANVNNDIDADAKTGGNDAGKNTGGDVVIKTGSAKVGVDVSTAANVNSVRIGGGLSATPTPSASFWITGNGAGSDNEIAAALTNVTTVGQENNANVTNDVDADAKTGYNDANFNTGGDVVIMTGDAKAEVEVDNAVNFNFADVDCGCEWDVLAKIAGNGAEHGHGDKIDNYIGLLLDNVQAVAQGNNANLDNDIDDADAKTGKNETGYNTGDPGSDPAIVTGDATTKTSVSNSGNVNTVGDFGFEMPELPEVDFSFNFAALWAFFGMSI